MIREYEREEVGGCGDCQVCDCDAVDIRTEVGNVKAIESIDFKDVFFLIMDFKDTGYHEFHRDEEVLD